MTEIRLTEYGNAVTVTRRMLHYSMGYVCPDEDICNICNYVPAPPTRKQKRQRKISRIKWLIGQPFGRIGAKFGYIHCDYDHDYD